MKYKLPTLLLRLGRALLSLVGTKCPQSVLYEADIFGKTVGPLKHSFHSSGAVEKTKHKDIEPSSYVFGKVVPYQNLPACDGRRFRDERIQLCVKQRKFNAKLSGVLPLAIGGTGSARLHNA